MEQIGVAMHHGAFHAGMQSNQFGLRHARHLLECLFEDWLEVDCKERVAGHRLRFRQ